MRSRKAAVPESVIELERQFEQFRSTRTGRPKLPAMLWQAAVEQAREHGANVVAHTLRLDYNALKKWLSGGSTLHQQPSPDGFVELVAGVSSGTDEYVIEFETSPSPRMRVQWKSATAPDWMALWREAAG